MLLCYARVFGSVFHSSRLHSFSMLLIPVMYYPPNSTYFGAVFDAFNHRLKTGLIPLCVTRWGAIMKRKASFLSAARRCGGGGGDSVLATTKDKHKHSVTLRGIYCKSVSFIKASHSPRSVEFPERKLIWIRIVLLLIPAGTLTSSRRMEMRCFRREVNWNRRLFLPDFYVEMISERKHGKPSQWK